MSEGIYNLLKGPPLPREIVPQQRDRFALREFRLLDISKDRYVEC